MTNFNWSKYWIWCVMWSWVEKPAWIIIQIYLHAGFEDTQMHKVSKPNLPHHIKPFHLIIPCAWVNLVIFGWQSKVIELSCNIVVGWELAEGELVSRWICWFSAADSCQVLCLLYIEWLSGPETTSMAQPMKLGI